MINSTYLPMEPAQQAPQLPEIVSLANYKDNRPELPAELISGVLHCGHKMLISSSSKAGKSFMLMELAIAIAEGLPWLGFKCKQGKVLFLNMEIDRNSCINRFYNIYDALKIFPANIDSIDIWNLRGHVRPLNELVPVIVKKAKSGYTAIMLDPIYKVMMGDENSASDIAKLTNEIDKICRETGCALVYSHHHSKGIQGNRRSIDRSSGSGVFARDPDTILDMVELVLPKELQEKGKTAWRLEGSLREFLQFDSVDIWYKHPIHTVDETGVLKGLYPEGSPHANLSKSSKQTTKEQRKKSLDQAYKVCKAHQPVKVKDLAKEIGVCEKTIQRYLQEFSDSYWYSNTIVGRYE